jgi:hypothetical protein
LRLAVVYPLCRLLRLPRIWAQELSQLWQRRRQYGFRRIVGQAEAVLRAGEKPLDNVRECDEENHGK